MKKSITNKRSLVLKKKVDKKPIEIQSLPAQEPTPMEQILLQMAQNQAKQNEMIEKQSAMLETISSQLNNAKKEEAVPEQPKKTQAEIVKGRNQVSVKEKIVWRICGGFMQKDGNMSREATHHAKFNTEQEAYEFARKTLGQYYQVFSETMYVSN